MNTSECEVVVSGGPQVITGVGSAHATNGWDVPENAKIFLFAARMIEENTSLSDAHLYIGTPSSSTNSSYAIFIPGGGKVGQVIGVVFVSAGTRVRAWIDVNDSSAWAGSSTDPKLEIQPLAWLR